MTRTRLLEAFIASLLSGTLSLLLAQTPSAGIEQQLRSQYRIASVGNNGVVVRAGTVVIIQQDGMTALQVTPEIPTGDYWPNTYKQGGHVGTSAMQRMNYAPLKNWARALQVGERAFLTSIQAKPSEIDFRLQTCPADPNETPYRASLAFQFPKGYLDSMKLKEIQDAIGQIFVPDTSSTAQGSDQSQAGTGAGDRREPPQKPSPVAQLRLPSTYVSAQTPTDQLKLNADNTFSLQEGGQFYQGIFVATGNSVELNISGGPKTTATIQGNNLTDSGGQAWVLQEQSAGTAPAGAQLKNEDIIKLVKAGLDDALIIAKIASSKCQFDTSTDALIQLKQSGVSAAVLKAVVAAGH